MNIGDLIVKCLDNNGVGDCPYKPVCIARLTDRTITGCNLPLVWEGLIDKSQAVIEHTIQKEGEKETVPKRRKKNEDGRNQYKNIR